MKRALPQIFVGALALSGCTNKEDSTAAPPANTQVGAAAVSDASIARRDRTPFTQAEYGTNEGELALHNLQSQIDGQQQLKARDPKNAGVNVTLASALSARGLMTGHLGDYFVAQTLADALVKAEPKNPQAWMLHASSMTTLHRFDDAVHDYAQAELVGEKPVELVGPRMSIDAARGLNEDAVVAYREKTAKEIPTFDSFMALALTQGERGDLAAATESYGKAQDAYRDTSPFPLALLYFQEGLLEQRAGSPARAKELFQAAHDRVPQYAQATSHLASVLAVTGDRDKAIALLEPLVAAPDTDDPEYAGQLAALLDDAGDHPRATKLRKETAVRYEALVKKYPLAFSDHAARFYLSGPKEQQNGKRALALAQINLKNRPTIEAQRLTIDAAIAAGNAKLACTVAEQILARPHVPPEAHVSASRAFIACGQKERADKEAAALAAAPAAPAK